MQSLRHSEPLDGLKILARLCTIWIFLNSVPSPIKAYVTNIPHGTVDECYHEIAPVGIKLGISFEVIEGGHYDIDFKILDPKNAIIQEDPGSTHGKFTIESNEEGSYKFCFSNARNSKDTKVVIFDLDRSDAKKTISNIGGEQQEEETDKIISMVDALMIASITARHDVRFLTARDRVHRKINNQTNSRIVWWSGMEFILLLVVTLGQVWYLRRFFEIRRKA